MSKTPMEEMLRTVNRVMDLTKEMMRLMSVASRPAHKYSEKPFAHVACPVFHQTMQIPKGVELNGQVHCVYCDCAVPLKTNHDMAQKPQPENLSDAAKVVRETCEATNDK
jgi:hypothetical protein